MRTLFGVNILVIATINVIKYKHNCDVKIDVQRNLMLCSVTSHNIRSHNMRDCVSKQNQRWFVYNCYIYFNVITRNTIHGLTSYISTFTCLSGYFTKACFGPDSTRSFFWVGRPHFCENSREPASTTLYLRVMI